MPRPLRVQVEGALCYVTSRALEATPLFRDAKDYDTYFHLIKLYQDRFQFHLYAYLLLPNELHLCLELHAGTTVSALMHALNSRYTKYVTKRYGRNGHLFQERFKLTLLEKAPSLLRITGYLHTLPRRAGFTREAREYRWSSGPTYLAALDGALSDRMSRATAQDGLCRRGEVEEVRDALQRQRPGWTYALYLEAVTESEWELMSRELEESVVGSPAFRQLVEERRKAASHHPAASQGMGVAAPVGSRAPQRFNPATATSLLMATLSMVAVLFFLRNITTLKHTVRVLAEENQLTFSSGLSGRTGSPFQLATFNVPRQLGGTIWDIQVKPMLGEGGSAEADRLQFDHERMSSTQLSLKGFPASRYLVKPQPNGIVLWESVQIGPGGEMVSWRGEWSGQTLHGVLTRQMPGGGVSTFRFVGINLRHGDGTEPSTRSRI